jgi:hypothetical protein
MSNFNETDDISKYNSVGDNDNELFSFDVEDHKRKNSIPVKCFPINISGFTVICNKCGSTNVRLTPDFIEDYVYDGALELSYTGNVLFECEDCGQRGDYWGEYDEI